MQKQALYIIAKAAKLNGVALPDADDIEDIIRLIEKYHGTISPEKLMRVVEYSTMNTHEELKCYGRISAEWFGRIINAVKLMIS